MRNFTRTALPAGLLASLASGCGTSVSQLPEVWDRQDNFSTASMEMQIKQAIYCELRESVKIARDSIKIKRESYGKNVTSEDDLPFPDNWGAQIEITFTADEKSTFSPGASLKNPLSSATVALASGPQIFAQSYATGLGGVFSSQNVRQDKFDYFYSARDLLGPTKFCKAYLPTYDAQGHSSLFVEAGNLGIRDWLPGAVAVIEYRRSSRKQENGEGAPLALASQASDSATYDNKFVIVTSGNISPVWNLVRVATPASALFDVNRTRTHDLLITIGATKETGQPGAPKDKKIIGLELNQAATNAHLASQIGNAIGAQLRPP